MILWVFVWRLLWTLIVSRTFFVADEYYQSVEVAHHLVYGLGELTHEWTGPRPIRSALYPVLLAVPMKILQVLGWDHRWAVWGTPLVMQAGLAAWGDVLMSAVAESWFGADVGHWALVLNMTSWAVLYCWGRTLTNVLEAILMLATIRATQQKWHRAAAALMALNFVVRPTSALPWVVWALFVQNRSVRDFLKDSLPAGLGVVALCTVVDRLFFGFWTLTWMNFFFFNINSASFYGVHPWHWYLSNGWPTVLLVYLPLVAFGIRGAPLKWPAFVFIVIPTAFLSIIPHKEFRFLLPSLSVAIAYCAIGAAKATRGSVRGFLWILVAVNLGAAAYFGAFHQRGPIAASSFLAAHVQPGQSIGLMVPCHNIPAYAHWHANVTLWQLRCDPGTLGESDMFFELFDDPDRVPKLLEYWNDPDFVVVFQPLFDEMDRMLSWKRVMESFHAHFPVDSRHGHRIAVYMRSKN